tara:strand:+ start:414 stop:542 length:129 start_codon:yes stop_codon:yes gene_type:complete
MPGAATSILQEALFEKRFHVLKVVVHPDSIKERPPICALQNY